MLEAAAFDADPIAMPGRRGQVEDSSFYLEPTRENPALPDPFGPSQEEVDPLRRLSARDHRPTPDLKPGPKPSWNHTPGVNDHFTPPPARTPEEVIPEDWNQTVFGRTKLASEIVGDPSPAPADRNSAPPNKAIPANWAETSFGVKKSSAEAMPGAASQKGAAQSPSVGERPDRRSSQADFAAPLPDRRIRQRQQPAAPSRTPPKPAQVPPRFDSPTREGAPAPAQGGPRPGSQAPIPGDPEAERPSRFDVDAFFRSAGLNPADVPPERAAALGQILRTVVQGVVEVLHARAEVKDQFRLAMTRVKLKENNPLKFSVNAENALCLLLGRPDPAYLAPVEAFEDAMDDIRFHQLAMLAGMRAGFDHMMKRFDPSQLQQLFDKRAKRGGLLAMGAKARYWEMYSEEFGELTADPEEAFRRVFGEEFASAYQKQLNTLKHSQGKLNR
jgi:type VI secretion system FHA domain protein